MQQSQPLTPARRGGKVDISLNMSNLTSLLIKSGVKINSDRQKIILGFGPISQMEAPTFDIHTHIQFRNTKSK